GKPDRHRMDDVLETRWRCRADCHSRRGMVRPEGRPYLRNPLLLSAGDLHHRTGGVRLCRSGLLDGGPRVQPHPHWTLKYKYTCLRALADTAAKVARLPTSQPARSTKPRATGRK